MLIFTFWYFVFLVCLVGVFLLGSGYYAIRMYTSWLRHGVICRSSFFISQESIFYNLFYFLWHYHFYGKSGLLLFRVIYRMTSIIFKSKLSHKMVYLSLALASNIHLIDICPAVQHNLLRYFNSSDFWTRFWHWFRPLQLMLRAIICNHSTIPWHAFDFLCLAARGA